MKINSLCKKWIPIEYLHFQKMYLHKLRYYERLKVLTCLLSFFTAAPEWDRISQRFRHGEERFREITKMAAETDEDWKGSVLD